MGQHRATGILSSDYPDAIRALIGESAEAELGAGCPNESLRGTLQQFDLGKVNAPRRVVEPTLALACHAGLWLAHNFLDESHAISQHLEDSTGSFWHGIMHRREGDFDNAKYWFRRVGDHPVYDPLREAAATIAAESPAAGDPAADFLRRQKRWDAVVFVDLVRKALAGGSPQTVILCRRIARAEWELLFAFCYSGALPPHPPSA